MRSNDDGWMTPDRMQQAANDAAAEVARNHPVSDNCTRCTTKCN